MMEQKKRVRGRSLVEKTGREKVRNKRTVIDAGKRYIRGRDGG